MPRITILRNDRSSRLLRAIGPILLFLPLLPPQAFAQEAAPPTIVYLVRHAEKDTTDTTNPELTPEGKVRAEALAALLEDAGIDAIYSTDFRRTRQTAAPLATHLDLEVVRYDPRGLPAFAARLRTLPGRHLVSGHSDTTPALVRLLGGDPGPPIPDSEYDRLYILVIPPQGEVTTVVIRYGDRSHGEGWSPDHTRVAVSGGGIILGRPSVLGTVELRGGPWETSYSSYTCSGWRWG